jgi:hypothetical protein
MKVGDKVRWHWGSGTATGTVKETFDRHVERKIKGSEITRNGSPENPALLIEQEDGDASSSSPPRWSGREGRHPVRGAGGGALAGPLAPPAPEVPAGLVYVTDSIPGIRRLKRGKGWSYLAPDGTTIERGAERERLEKLGVPPAYENVWMCPLPHGHLQATGFDQRARKQYRYHMLWSQHRSGNKFDKLEEFGHALPAIRDRVARDLKAAPGEARFALAAAVTLIDRLSLRVGNEEYARENGSYGALTLRNKHVKLREGEIRSTSRPSPASACAGSSRTASSCASSRRPRTCPATSS